MLVKDVMTTEVVTVDPRCKLEYALWLMNDKNVHRLPVLEAGKLVGLIVQHDIERALRSPQFVLKSPVEWVMTRNPVFICPDISLADAAQLMLDKRIGCLPVVEAEILVGILGTSDLLKVLISLLNK